MAQTIEGFVGKSLDEAKISPLHVKIVGLIAAGYFFDVIDFTIFGSLNPFMTKSFASPAEFAFIGSAAIFGMAIGTAGQGQLSDRFGRRFIYQFNLLLFGTFTILGALAPSVWLLILCRFIAGIGLGAEQPLAFAYAGEYAPKAIRGRILAIVHFIGGAMVWPIGTALVLLFGSIWFTPESADYVWRGVWLLIGVGALIVWVFRFTLPESPRYLATHGRGDDAIAVLKRLGIEGPKEPLSTDAASDSKSDPFAVVFKMFPMRVIAGMICFTAFFGFAIGVGAWLPNIYMVDKGFTITKSLQYVLAMNFAVPCASIFMMYALDNLGRKVTSVCAFIAAGVMVIVFANASSDTALLVAGFVMVFFVQVAGNAMQIFCSEVFPTNARASGFGWSSGVGRIATAFIIPGIQLVRGSYGIETVFICIAIMLAVAALMVTQLGPEAKRLGLDEVAPPTNRLVEAGQAFWLKFVGFGLIGLSIVWWIDFFLAVKEIKTGIPCFVYRTAACSAIDSSKLIGHLAYQPYLLWIGVVVLAVAFVLSSKRSGSASQAAAS